MDEKKQQDAPKDQVAIRRSQTRRVNAIVGLITAIGVVALLWFTVRVTDATFFKSGYWIKVRFDEIIGLQEGDLVTFSGMVVGKVKYIDLVEDRGKTRIQLTCFIEDKTRKNVKGEEETYPIYIPDDSVFDIRSSSLLGGVTLVIDRGQSKVPIPDTRNPDKIEKEDIRNGLTPISLVKEIERTAKSVGDLATETKPYIKNTLQNVENITRNAEEYVKRMNEGPGLLHGLAYDKETYVKLRSTVDSLNKFVGKLGEKTSIVDNLDASIYNVKKITDNFAGGEGFLPYLISDRSKPMVGKVNSILDNVSIFSARLAADNSFIARIQGPEGEALFHDISEIIGRVRALTNNMENSSVHMLLSDEGKLYEDFKDFAESLRLLGRQVTGRGVPKDERNSIARLLTDKGELYDDAMVGVKSLRKFMEPLARLKTNVIVGHHSYNGQELGVTRFGIKLIPRRSRYFLLGGSLMSPDKNGPIVFDEDDKDNGKSIIFIDLQVAQHIWLNEVENKPDDWRNVILTGRVGLLEGKFGAGVDLDFCKNLRLTVEARDSHTDHKDFDENVEGTLLRSEISFKFAKYFRVHVGADNLIDDPDWSFGFSVEFEDPDIRALVAVAGTGQ
ncbi:MAG: MCE family protein [Planctomycetota bacterium]|nr:MAG: MCE family protein [Planctomycetota bacterium]